MSRAEGSRQPEVAAVQAHDLGFRYGDRVALSGVSFQVARGEIFGFLGPNGGGKTTLFRILATLAVPAEGEARIFGREVVSGSSEVRRALGVVFQSPSVDPHLTLRENLIHQGHLYGLRGRDLERRVEHQLDLFELAGRTGDPVKSLSGGLRRRLELAKALIHRPELLLLDEPSSGLDPGVRRDLWGILEQLRAEREVTVLVTTHFMEEGDRCDRLALVDGGEIVAQGSPKELKADLGGDVLALTCEEPEAVCGELNSRWDLEARVFGTQIRLHHPQAHDLLGRLSGELGDCFDEVRVSKPTLEDVFLQRTGHQLWRDRP